MYNVIFMLIIFILGILIGTSMAVFYLEKFKASGRLLIDESGEVDRWTLFMDDPMEEIKNKPGVYLTVDRRTGITAP